MGLLGGVFAFVFILTNVQARHQHSSSHLLNRLLSSRSSNSQSPTIVIIDTRDQSLERQSDSSQLESDERGDEAPGDEVAYQLYSQLRYQPEGILSSGEMLRDTKQALRAALISRCRKMDNCANKCPKSKKFSCVMVCQQKFDKENVCDEPVEEPECEIEDDNKCGNKQKWGKTMPPRWLLI